MCLSVHNQYVLCVYRSNNFQWSFLHSVSADSSDSSEENWVLLNIWEIDIVDTNNFPVWRFFKYM